MRSTKVARLGLELDPTYTYYVVGTDVWRVQRRNLGEPATDAPERVAETGVAVHPKYIYFLDVDGDISCSPRPDLAD